MTAFPAQSQPGLELICSRTIPFVDTETLANRTGREALFRKNDSFLLYLSDGEATPLVQERVVSLSARQALLWLNERADELGSLWA